jgi:ech hydrogenase subunit C
MSHTTKSPWIVHYDGSSCNGCDIEVLAALTPLYDVERFGIINSGNPKHADIFLITGSINEQNRPVVEQIYEQMLEPKVVVACGICACSGGIFKDCYNILGGADSCIPVDVYAPGCAVRPECIIDAVVKGLDILEEKRKKLKQEKKSGKKLNTPEPTKEPEAIAESDTEEALDEDVIRVVTEEEVQ